MHPRSLRDPESFWAEAAEAVHWHQKWTAVARSQSRPILPVVPGGLLNTCYCAVDRHANGARADQLALIYDSPVTGVIQTLHLPRTSRRGGASRGSAAKSGRRQGRSGADLHAQHAGSGDDDARVGPPWRGALRGLWRVCVARAGGTYRRRAPEGHRLGILRNRARAVIAYKPLLDGALAARVAPAGCLPGVAAADGSGSTRAWTRSRVDRRTDGAEPVDECVPVLATDPLYILYTSGTTGKPKGVVHDNGGYAVALAWSMRNIYGAEPGDVYWAASDLGWAVGHSYIVYGPLLHGCTTVLYEGKPVGTPDAGAFWRVISQHGVNILFTAPTAFRAIKRADPQGSSSAATISARFGRCSSPASAPIPTRSNGPSERLGVPVIDHWWQTETGWPICANPIGLAKQPVKYGSAAKPMPGYSVSVVDACGREVKKREIGNIVIKLPLPPGCLPTLWNNDDGFVSSYLTDFPGFYKTADAGFEDEDGYFWIMTRTDDVINVAGHRLSTGEMEEVLASHPDVAECAVVGVHDPLKGQVPFGFLVLKAGVTRDAGDVIGEVVTMVRDRIGPVAAFKQATIVERLPKTRSGKVLRGTMRSIADGQPVLGPGDHRRSRDSRRDQAGASPLRIWPCLTCQWGFGRRCMNIHSARSFSLNARVHTLWPVSGYSVYLTALPAALSAATSSRDAVTGMTSSLAP